MKLSFYRIFASFLLIFFSAVICADTTKYITELSELSPLRKMQFNHIKTLIDSGKYRNKDVILSQTNRFIKNQPNFLPIYIQQVRYITRTDWHYETKPKILWKKAESILLDTKIKEPNYFKTYDMLAFVYFNQNRFGESEAENNTALILNPEDPWANIQAAQINIKFNKLQEAKKIISKLLNKHYKDKRITIFSVRLLKEINSKQAPTITREIFADFLRSTNVSKNELVNFTNETISEFGINSQLLYASNILINYLLKLDKEHVPTKLLLADYYLALGYQYTNGLRTIHNEKALTEAKNVLLSIKRKNNLNPEIYSKLAGVFFSENNLEGMAAILNEAKNKQIRSSSLINLGASFFAYQRNYKKAIPMYNSLLKKEDRYAPEAESGLLFIYRKNGNINKAEEIYTRRIKQNPSSAYDHGNYATFLLNNKGEIDSAINQAEKAIQIMDYGIARTTLAAAYYAKWATLPPNDQSASIYYKKANKLQPNVNRIKGYCGKYCKLIFTKVENIYKNTTTYK